MLLREVNVAIIYFYQFFGVIIVKMEVKDYVKNDSLKIIVRSNSRRNELVEFDNVKQALKVNIKAVPEKGKANLEVIKFFNKLTKKQTRIIKGLTSREKLLEFF